MFHGQNNERRPFHAKSGWKSPILSIGQEEFKLVQYADDLTLFVPSLECAQRLFHLLDKFESCSGLKVNFSKTEAMWIGSFRLNTKTTLGLNWCNSVKALRIAFTYDDVNSAEELL